MKLHHQFNQYFQMFLSKFNNCYQRLMLLEIFFLRRKYMSQSYRSLRYNHVDSLGNRFLCTCYINWTSGGIRLSQWTFTLKWNCSPNMKVKYFNWTKELFIFFLFLELKKQFAETESGEIHFITSGPYSKIWTANGNQSEIVFFFLQTSLAV